MLSSKALSKGIPSLGARRALVSQPPSSLRTTSKLGTGRQFGTLLQNRSARIVGTPLPRSTRLAAAPLVLGGISSSRQFSLSFWNYGKKNSSSEGAASAANPENTTVVGAETAKPAAAETVAPPVAPEADLSAVTPTEPDLTAIENIINGQDILNLPDGLGYLHALGLDYGWGPTSVMQWIVEHIHVWGGLGYGATFLSIGFLLRVALFYPHVRQLKFNARMAVVKQDPRFKTIMEMRQKALAQGDTMQATQASALNKSLNKEYGVSNWEMLWSFLPIPFSFGLFRLVKGMTDVPVPGLENAGFAWFTDLTVSDPYFVLPMVSAAMFTGSIMAGMKYIPQEQQKMMKTMSYFLTPLTLFVACWFSAGLNLIATSVGAAAFLQTLVTNTTIFRKLVGLPTRVTTAYYPAAVPTTGTYQAPKAANPVAADLPHPEPKSFGERVSNSYAEAKKSAKSAMDMSQIGNMMSGGGNAEMKEKYKKQADRKKGIEALEKKAGQRRKEEWESKFKR